MSDYSELKRLAEAAQIDGPYSPSVCMTCAEVEFAESAGPAEVLALIAENERLAGECEGCPMSIAEELRKDRDQLKAENEALRQERDSQQRLCIAEIGKNEALRKQIDDMSSFKGAPLTGPDLKCLACGDYHYGMIGLPCPKMAPHASAAMSQGEKP